MKPINISKLCDYYGVQVLRGLPKNLWKDLLKEVTTEEELYNACKNLAEFKKKEKIRDEVIRLQNTHKLPLHPNDSLERTKMLVAIKLAKDLKNNPIENIENIEDNLDGSL